MIDLIKVPIVSAYYLGYVMFSRWMNWKLVVALLVVAIAGMRIGMNGKEIGGRWKTSFCFLVIILYLGIVSWVFQYGGLVASTHENILHMIYIVGICWCVMQMTNKKWIDIADSRTEVINPNNVTLYDRIKNVLWAVFGISMLPILAISPYIFPRADDNNFGYRGYWAWERTGSVVEVIKAAFETIEEAYFGWQGTYTSIFMMAIHPAVFDEKLYRIVPLFFITIIILASYFFVKTILVDWLHTDKKLSVVCISAYLLMVIQCIPVKQSAFLWYNGAIHYIGSYCMLLCMLAFLVRLYIGKKKWSNWLLGAFCAFYVGGGNHVTAVTTLLIVLTLLFLLTITKKWKCYGEIGGICFVYLLALAVNILAPGNFNKMGMAKGTGMIGAFLGAFVKVGEYIFGEWMHWSVIAVIALCLPIMWRMVQNMKISFSYPLLFIGYSWCYMASLFFTPLFTISTVEVGRFQNIMFLQGILWLLFDIGYIMGWIQKKYFIENKSSFCVSEKRYVYTLGILVLWMMLLSAIAEPKKYTSIYALNTLKDPQLQEYAADYWHNVEILKSDKREVTIKDLSNIPEFLHPVESDVWHSALRLVYDKDKINYEKSMVIE